MSVEDHRRIGLVGPQKPVERLMHRCHLGFLERSLGVQRGVTGGEQQPVALAERDLEVLGQAQNHLAARPRSAGLEEAHVARGHVGLERKLELAEAAAPAPGAEELADGSAARARMTQCCVHAHDPNLARRRGRRNYLAGRRTAPGGYRCRCSSRSSSTCPGFRRRSRRLATGSIGAAVGPGRRVV